MSDLAATARRGIGWTTVSVASGALAGMLQLAVAARFLSQTDFGVMALVVLVTGFSENVSDLGMSNAILHRQRASREELSSVFWLSAALGVALCAAVAASAPVFAALWDAPALTGALPLGALVFLASGASQVAVSVLRRRLRYRRLAALELAQGGVSLVLVAGLAVAGYGVLALVAGFVAARFVRAALGLWLGRDAFRPSLHFARADLAPFLDFGVFQVGERFVLYASRNLDKLVIGGWLGAEALGVYHLAYQLMARAYRLVTAVSQRVTQPLLASLQDDRDRLVRAYLTGIRVLALLAAPLFVGAALVAESLVALVYGPGWDEVAAVFRILAPLGMVYVVGNLDGALVIATGKARVAFAWNAFGAAVHLVAVGIGVGFGVRGVAVAVVVATAVVLLPSAFYLRWVLVALRPAPYLASVAAPLTYAGVMGVAVYALAPWLGDGPAAVRLLALGLWGALVYGSIVWARDRAWVTELRGG